MKKLNKKSIIKLSIIALAVVIISLMTALVLLANKEALGIDAVVRDFFYNIRGEKGGLIYWVTRVVTELGDIIAVAVVLVIIGIATKFDHRFVVFAIALLVMEVTKSTFKDIMFRTRPYEEFRWQYEASSSFPSGHSTCAATLYVFVLLLILDSNLSDKIKLTAKIVCPSLVVIVMCTRLVLGVHYFSDVLTGASLGTVVALGCSFLLEPVKTLYNKIALHFKKN